MATIEEKDGENRWVIDDCEGCDYLVGLAQRSLNGVQQKLFLARIDPPASQGGTDTKVVDAYMALNCKFGSARK